MSSRQSSESVNEKDDLVGEFDASTCSGGNFYDIFRMRKKSLLNIQLLGSTLIKNGEVGSLESLSMLLQRIPNI